MLYIIMFEGEGYETEWVAKVVDRAFLFSTDCYNRYRLGAHAFDRPGHSR